MILKISISVVDILESSILDRIWEGKFWILHSYELINKMQFLKLLEAAI